MVKPNKPFRTRGPWYSPTQLTKSLLVYAAIAYGTVCTYLYLAQNSLEYPREMAGVIVPLPEAVKEARMSGLEPWPETTTGAIGPQGFIPTDFSTPHPRGTIVVFHGNGSWAADGTSYLHAFTRRGFRTFLYEYPGYGPRPGRPSERIIVPDARAVIRQLDREGLGPIYIWGESLGSGVAAAVCADAKLPVHGLVLMMPWDTVANVGLDEYPYIPVELLMTDSYDSVSNLKYFAHPVCVLRGSKDPVIPPKLTLHLFAQLPGPKKMILEDGYGHGDWPNSSELLWWDEALDFIASK